MSRVTSIQSVVARVPAWKPTSLGTWFTKVSTKTVCNYFIKYFSANGKRRSI